MTPSEFRRMGHALVDWVADYRERVSTLPVMSRVAPRAIREQMPAHAPEEGGTLDAIALDLTRIVLPGITHWNHAPLLRLLPVQLVARGGPRRSRDGGRLRCPGDELADEPGGDRDRRGHDGVAPRARRIAGDVHGGHPGHGVDGDAGRAAVRARAGDRIRAEESDGLQGARPPSSSTPPARAHASVDKAALLAGYGRAHVHG